MKKYLILSLFFASCIDKQAIESYENEAKNTSSYIQVHNKDRLGDCVASYLMTDIWPYKVFFVRCPNSTTTTIRKYSSGKQTREDAIIVDDAQPD